MKRPLKYPEDETKPYFCFNRLNRTFQLKFDIMNVTTAGGSITPRRSFFDLQGDHVQRYVWASQFAKLVDVIDVGCGHGYGSQYLADGIAHSVLGVDNDRKAIDYADRHYEYANLKFSVVDVLNARLKEDFDLAISFEVIEHIANPKPYLEFVDSCLRKNGEFLLSTPNKLYTEQTYINGKSPNPYHVKEYYPKELQALISKYFDVISVHAEYEIFDYDMKDVDATRLVATCPVPKSIQRMTPEFIKGLYFRLRGYERPRPIGGRYQDFRIDEVDNVDNFGRNKPVQL